jgi:hypothetical protein
MHACCQLGYLQSWLRTVLSLHWRDEQAGQRKRKAPQRFVQEGWFDDGHGQKG